MSMEIIASKLNAKKIIDEEFLFSIIVPVYKVEDYLEDTLKSIISQTLNFENHVQLILVNDGSPDDSDKICLKYHSKFPNNIVYIDQENQGVAAARSKGLMYAQGRYVNFIDSDDTLDTDVLEKVYNFFRDNEEEIDAVSIPIYFFEARKGPHILNYKFNISRIVDINEEPLSIQMNVSSVFFKKEALSKLEFDHNLKYGEDAKFFTMLVSQKMKYGIVSNAFYNYRIRTNASSAIQNSTVSKVWYNQSLEFFSLSLIEFSIAKWGYVPQYVQAVILYDLQWKIKLAKAPNTILNSDEKTDFWLNVQKILEYIDNDIILKMRFMTIYHKNALLNLKSNKDTSSAEIVTINNDALFIINKQIVSKLEKQKLYVTNIDINQRNIEIEGFFSTIFPRDIIEIKVKSKGKLYSANRVDRPYNNVTMWDMTIKEVYGFSVTLSYEDLKEKNIEHIEFFVDYKSQLYSTDLVLTRSNVFSREDSNYYTKDDLIISSSSNKLIVQSKSTLLLLKKEFKYIWRLIKLSSKRTGAKKAIKGRIIYHSVLIFRSLLRLNKIHIYMDRWDKAGDNAEALFKYALKQDDQIDKFFVLDKRSSDFERMKEIGSVLEFGSQKHKLYMLLADKFISSHADDDILYPFKKMTKYYKDLHHYDFVFLQHGVIQNDLSSWLNKFNKKIKLFVSSSPKEYESLISSNYSYSEQEVKLTGLPRHDLLENIEGKPKQILIAPTWRKNLAMPFDKDNRREYNKDFKSSEFFKNYNELLCDNKLQKILAENDWRIKFVLHPNFSSQYIDFLHCKNDRIMIEKFDDVSYKELFNESTILITDYSSVSFDFAYLRKPVIYYQFDKDDFFSSHLNPGYFSYETDGFGDVVGTSSSLINSLEVLIENSGHISDLYSARINSFFAYADQNNSFRVYNEIMNLKK